MHTLLLVTAALLPLVEPSLPPAYREALLGAAAGYKKTPYGMVTLEPDRSPVDCRAPTFWAGPGRSNAATGGHDRKLYYLYAQDVGTYRHGTQLARDWHADFPGMVPKSAKVRPPVTEQPVGQVIVKESWNPVVVADKTTPVRPKLPWMGLGAETRFYHDNQVEEIGEQGALFLMAKVAPKGTEGTDDGWVYATATPDGKTLTAAGLLPTCMGCHTKAPHDRLFGPKDRW